MKVSPGLRETVTRDRCERFSPEEIMSRRRRGFLTSLCLSIVLVSQLKATDESGGRAAGNSGSSFASNPSDPELQVIRDRMAKQQEEIKKLQQALDEQKVLLEKALERLAAPMPGGPETVRAEMAPASSEAKLIPVNVAHPRIAAAGRWQNLQSSNPSPLSIKIG